MTRRHPIFDPTVPVLLLAIVLLGGCRSARLGPGARGAGRGLEDLGLRHDDTIVTESARTVDFNGQAFVPRYTVARRAKGTRDLLVQVAAAKVVFGLDRDLVVAATVSQVSKRLEREDPATGSRETLRAQGLGDLPVVGKYRFFQETGAGETTEAAAIFGLELPTGRDDLEDGGRRLPPPLQPGSGAVDGILGGAFTRVDGRWVLNADAIGKFHSEANGYRFGPRLRVDVGGQFRLYPARYERFDQTTVNLVAEANAVLAGRDTQDGQALRDTGGWKLFLAPGLQVIVTDSLLLEAAVQIPALVELHGSQPEERYVGIVGLRFRF